MSVEAVIDDLRRIYGDEPNYRECVHLKPSDLKRWSMTTGLDRGSLLTEIALSLAQGFHESSLTYEFCDAVINDIVGHVTSELPPGFKLGDPPVELVFPNLVFEVYCAFDEGEYSHRGRPKDEDPVEAYTRPMVAQIVARLSSN